MITKSFRETQIHRMGGLDKYPTFAAEAEAELVTVASKFGRSEAHLRGVIDEIMAVWTQCPKPSELRALLDRDRQEKVNLNCPDCQGSGWKIVTLQKGERFGLGSFASGESGAMRCGCGSVPRPPGEAVPDKGERKPSTGFTKVGDLLQ